MVYTQGVTAHEVIGRNVVEAIGEKVEVAAANDTKEAGDWVCTGVSQSRKTDGIVEFKLDLTQWTNLTVQ